MLSVGRRHPWLPIHLFHTSIRQIWRNYSTIGFTTKPHKRSTQPPGVASRCSTWAPYTMTDQQLFVCRHGERIDFVDGSWIFKATRPFDPPLSDHGRQQATKLGQRLLEQDGSNRVKFILCSPYIRCIETIYPFAVTAGIKIYIEYALSEWFGEATEIEGEHLPLSPQQLQAQFPLIDTTWESLMPQRTSGIVSDVMQHEVSFEFAKRLLNRFYSPENYTGDVLLATHAAAVVSVARGILAASNLPESPLPKDYFFPGGKGRHDVYAGVTCMNIFSRSVTEKSQDNHQNGSDGSNTSNGSTQDSQYSNWAHSFNDDNTKLPDPSRHYNWRYRPDRVDGDGLL